MPRGYIAKEETYELAVTVVDENGTSCTNIDLSDSDVAYIKAADAFVAAYSDWLTALYRRVDAGALRMCAVCSALIGRKHLAQCIWAVRGFDVVVADHAHPPTVAELAEGTNV